MTPAPTPSIQQRVDQRRRPTDLPLGLRFGIVAAIAVLMLVVGSTGVLLVREFSEASALVTHTQQVQQTLSVVAQRLADAEVDQRGILLTNSEEVLDSYRGAATDVTQSLARLRGLVGNDEVLLRQLTVLNQVVETRLTALPGGIDPDREAQPYYSELLRLAKQQMDSVRSLVKSMNDTQGAKLSAKQAQLNRWGLVAVGVIAPVSLVVIALLLVVGISIRRDIALRKSMRERIEEQNAELESTSLVLAGQQKELEQQREKSQMVVEDLETANRELQHITEVAEDQHEAAIHARDLARVSDSRYRFLADTLPIQVWTAAADGQLDAVSQSVADYFGRSKEEIIGEGWLSVMHPEDVSPAVERWTHSLATGEPYEVHVRFRRKDGAYRWHIGQALAQRDENNEVESWFGSNTDIDDARQAGERRARLMRNLERANHELDQFAHVASHDLKAPLRGIGNLSEWIEEEIGPSFPPGAHEKMELLRGRVRRLEALIDGLLEYSRAGRVRNAPALVDSNELIGEMLALLNLPDTVRVEVAADLPNVVSERVPLQQVFGNLLGNALKYAGRSDIRLRIAGSVEGDYVHFAVADNGPGIALQFHDRIFVLFQRLAARDKVEGTGVGLAIVKKIVEGRGGRVWVQSPTDEQLGTGTSFHFLWPRESIAEQ